MNNWDLIAEQYNKLVGDTGDIYHKVYINPLILKILGNIKNKKVLDLACGQGYFSRILAARGARIVGIDYSRELIKIAKAREKKKPLGIQYYCRNSGKLKGLKNNFFDVIVMNMTLHNIKNVKSTIKECSRVLKVKGRVIFSILHPWRNIAKNVKGKKGYFLKVEGYKNIICKKSVFANLDVDIYCRPIEFYFKEFFKNKFVISGFWEVGTKHYKGKQISDEKLLYYRSTVPSFLIVEAVKLK